VIQCISWTVEGYSTNQEIACCYRTRKLTTVIIISHHLTILRHLNSGHILTVYFPKIRSNIILLPTTVAEIK